MVSTSLPCPKLGSCPGCPLGRSPYTEALQLKAATLGAAITPYADLTPELLPARGADFTLGYRLRAKLVSHGKSLGLFERGSHRVIDLDGCPVLAPALLATANALRCLLPLPIYGADLRESSEGVLVTLLSEQETQRAALEQAAKTLVNAGAAHSVALSWRRKGDVRLLAGEPRVVVGPGAARHALSAEAPYSYAAHGGFVQAHAGQARYVYGAIADGLRSRASSRVLELYAGNGSLALALARDGFEVTAVESYAPAISLCERAAREQRLTLSAIAGDAARFAANLRPGAYDAIVVNPPRRGLDAALRSAIGRIAPHALVYVSCNPRTLARDAWHLSQLGLRLARAEPLDMIPWSDAVEVLAWFEPAPRPAPSILFQGEGYVAVDKTPHESLHELRERVRRLDGCEQAEPVERWGPGVSGVCWFARNADVAAQSRGASERELLLLVRGTLRKQGTFVRRSADQSQPGARYKLQSEHGRHSLASALTLDDDEQGTLRDFAQVRHPVLGDPRGDDATNEYALHRHGLDRPFVHVARSQLKPAPNVVLEAAAPLAPDLAQVKASLASD